MSKAARRKVKFKVSRIKRRVQEPPPPPPPPPTPPPPPIERVQHNIEITPNRSKESNVYFNDGYDDMCVKILNNVEDAGLCNVISNACAPAYHRLNDIEIAPQIYVPDIPAGPSNRNAMTSNEQVFDEGLDGDDFCMAAMDEFEKNLDTTQGYYTKLGNKRIHMENTKTAVKLKKVRLQAVTNLGFIEIQSTHNQTVNKHNLSIKFNLKIEATYNIPNVESSSENRAFKTSAREIFADSDLSLILEDCFNKLKCEEEEYTSKGSGFSFQYIDGILLGIYKYSPLSGSSYIQLPPCIDHKRATINPQNADQLCFKWAILAKHVEGENKYRINNNYTKHENKYSFEGISFPTPLSDIKKFEKNNQNVSINVYGIHKQYLPPPKLPTYTIFPLKVVDEEKRDHFDLLLVTENDKSHYIFIYDFSRLIRSQKTKHNGRVIFCKRCFKTFDDRRLDPTDEFNTIVQVITPSRYVNMPADFLRRIFSLMGNILSFILELPQKYKRNLFLETEIISLSSMVYQGENMLVVDT
ncbi:hypothetical protein QTP88_006482 [Uroleucon formosanum]